MIRLAFGFLAALGYVLLWPWRSWRRRRACAPGAWVRLELGPDVTDAPRPPRRRWSRAGPAPTSVHRVGELVDALIADPAPAGLLVTARRLRAPAAYRQGLREQLARLRAAGRPVVLELPDGGDVAELSLAGGASKIFLGAKTTLGPLGLRAGGLYLRRALDRVGVRPDVLARGSFKTAFENLVRDDMSPPQREQLGRMLDVLYDDVVGSLAAGRGVPADRARAWLDLGTVRAEEAARIGLADAALYDDEVPERLGDGPDRPARFVGAAHYLARRRAPRPPRLRPRPRVVVVEAHGAIVDRAPPFGGRVCDAERLVRLVRSLADDRRVVGVVLHVDSPGGGALASDRMHRALSKLAARKPLVACLGAVAASGGYYIAAAAARIVARPGTITGSIGVVAARPLFGPLAARLGVAPRYVTRGRRAEVLDPFRPLTEDERARFEADLEASYLDFLAAVAAGRGKTVEEVRPLAGGRVWTGVDAFERGLVDRLGGLDEALDEVGGRLELARADFDLVTAAPPAPSPWSARAWLGRVVARAALAEGRALVGAGFRGAAAGGAVDAWAAVAWSALTARETALAWWAGVDVE
jgi:protease-4